MVTFRYQQPARRIPIMQRIGLMGPVTVSECIKTCFQVNTPCFSADSSETEARTRNCPACSDKHQIQWHQVLGQSFLGKSDLRIPVLDSVCDSPRRAESRTGCHDRFQDSSAGAEHLHWHSQSSSLPLPSSPGWLGRASQSMAQRMSRERVSRTH